MGMIIGLESPAGTPFCMNNLGCWCVLFGSGSCGGRDSRFREGVRNLCQADLPAFPSSHHLW